MQKQKVKSNKQGGQAISQKKKKNKKLNNNQTLVLYKEPSQAPAAYASGARLKPPIIRQNGSTCRVKHSEFLSNVTGSSVFSLTHAIEIQPGLAASFPWLSNIANNWDEYTIHALRFRYLTRTGTSTAGSVIISPDYDSTDGPPTTEAIMTTFQGTREDAPWKDILCPLDPASMRGGMSRKFIRSLPLQPNQDIKTYDCGNLYLAVTDSSGTVGWGKLWVDYDIEFFVPSLHSTGTMGSGRLTTPGGIGVSLANPLGTAPELSGTAFGVSSGGTASQINLLQGGDYEIAAQFLGTGLTGVANPAFVAGTGTVASVLTAGSASSWLMTALLTGVSANALLQLGSLTGVTATASDVRVVRAIRSSLS